MAKKETLLSHIYFRVIRTDDVEEDLRVSGDLIFNIFLFLLTNFLPYQIGHKLACHVWSNKLRSQCTTETATEKK